MTFISYAQNFEDVMLWRALKHIEHGFYIDIGAQDPVVDSVSLAFYEHGWRGVHVEPSLKYAQALKIARPEEIVEQVAVCEGSSGPLVFFEIADTGLSTANKEIADAHRAAGFTIREIKVSGISLDGLLEKYSDRPIHWLKIDVEGLEASVLNSWHSAENHPWIIVVESTLPLTQMESFLDWERTLLDKNYSFAYFDGLNRFYVHKDHQYLVESFSIPPNIFDDFALSGLASQPFHRLITQQAETKAQQAETKAQQAETKAQQAAQYLEQLNAVYRSKSWRVTAPLRWVLLQFSLMKAHGPKARIKALAKKLIPKSAAVVRSHLKCKKYMTYLANRLGILEYLKLICFGKNSTITFSSSTKMQRLTPRARQIYDDLKAALEAQDKGDR